MNGTEQYDRPLAVADGVYWVGFHEERTNFHCNPYLILAGVMGGVVFLAGLFPFPNPLAAFIVQIIIGILVYACLCRMFRLEAFMNAVEGCRTKAWLKGTTFV